MLLRRSTPDAPLASARVMALAVRPRGGWLPPPEPGDAAVSGEAGPGKTVPFGAGPFEAGPEAAGPVGAGPEAEPAGEPPVAIGPAAPRRSWGSTALPETLRGGRLDPGAKGVAALVLVALLAALGTGAVVLRGRPQEVVVPAVESAGEPLPGVSAPPEPGAEVVVAVAGTVVAPGLVRLPAGSRVDDAVRAAGGLAPGADVGLLNLARKLVDGEQVLVGVDPPPGTAPAGAPAAGPGAAAGLVDLNTAGAAELDALPGIGAVLAQRIVDWRSENGRFASVDQLREVTGIGESKFRDLEDKVTV